MRNAGDVIPYNGFHGLFIRRARRPGAPRIYVASSEERSFLTVIPIAWYNSDDMQMRKIKLKVYSKINLSLNIEGVRGSLHALDSVMTSVDIADVITVCERFDDKLNVEFSCGNAFGENNTAYLAADILRKQFGDFGADIFIEKNIPVMAGMGGSSADAAGVIRALNCLFDFTMRGLSEHSAALKIGSDVPYMLYGGFARVSGSGENVKRIETDAELYFVTACGKSGVSTALSYAEFDKLHADKKFICSDNGKLAAALTSGDVSAVLSETGNALTEASCRLNPEISQTLELLSSVGAKKSIMTGSGAGCVGFFADFEEAAAAAEKLKEKGLAARASRSVKDGVEFL